MKKTSFLLISVFLLGALLLSGCNKKSAYKPQELEKITQHGHFQTLWRAKLPKAEKAYGYKLIPAYDDGFIYLAAQNGQVEKRNADSGQRQWQTDTGVELSAGPGVGDGLLAVAGPEGHVLVLDAATGQQQWQKRLGSEILAPPVIADGLLIVRLHDGHVHAFDAHSGQRRWVFDTVIPNLTLRGNSTPLVRAGRVYIGFDNGKVAAIRLQDGSVVWMRTVVDNKGKTELDRIVDIDGDMALVATELYLSSAGNKTMAVATESGNVLWSRDLGSATGVAVSRTHLYLSDLESTLHALNRDTGADIWERSGYANRQLTRPSYYSGQLLSGDLEGWLHVFNAATGTPLARKKFGSKGWFGVPLVVGDAIYLYNKDGTVSAVRYLPENNE
jgi:outer membrane protein assembly factor BamB